LVSFSAKRIKLVSVNHAIHKNLAERLHLAGGGSWITLLCFVAILNYLLQLLSFSLRLPAARMTAIWIPGGLLLAAFLLAPTSRWWTLILTFVLSFIAAFWSDRQLGLRIVVLSMPISFFAAALIARCLRGADGQLCFSTLRGFLKFAALQGLAFLLAVQLPIAVYQKLFGEPVPSSSVFAVRYLGEVLGCLFAAPAFALTAAVALRRAPARSTTSRTELLSALIAYVTVAAVVFVSPLTPFPALIFAPLPILLWGALRLGLESVSWMLLLLAVVATFGAIHGHGPFLALSPTNNLLQLQTFLIASGLPLQVLAAAVHERKVSSEALREGEERFRLAAQAGKMFAYEWDATTDAIVRSGESARILGIDESTPTTGEQVLAKVHPDDRERLVAAMAELNPEKPLLQVSYRIVHPNGTMIWVERNSRAHFDEQGRMQRIVGMVADITERKLAEQAQREYEKAVEGSEEMIAVVDREYRYLIANRKFLNYRGMTKEQVVGRLAPEILNPGVFESVVKGKLDECFSGKVVKYEMRYTYPELGERDLFISNFPIEGPVGVDRVVCILQDITERKRADEALRKSEEWLRLAVQAGRMYAFEWDAATDVIVRSKECRGILDWMDDPTRDTARQFVASVHPNDREAYAAGQAFTPENPLYQTSYRVVRPDGSAIWLEASGHISFDAQGNVRRIIGMVTDVTERKTTEEALRESEERLRMAAQAGRMYAYEWDVASDTVVRSPECADLLGLGSPAHTTRRELLDCLHPDDHGMCGDVSAVTPQNPTLRARYRIGRQDGTWMWAEKTARAFFDEQGKMVRMIGMVADITERVHADEALSSLSRRLIEAQEQERFRIAGELHDDVGQRMTLLQMGLDEFMQNADGLKPSARELLQNISELASEVSSDLHNVSLQLHPARLDLIGLVATVGDYCRELSRQHHLQVEFVHQNVPAETPKDVALCLFRIVQEALRNVVKHSGAAAATVELSGDGHQIHLRISDQGKGIDAGSAAGQTGLGLISMRERLRLVGGHVSVESQPSHGTRIRVRVPLAATDAAVTIEGKAHKAGA
jgi:PAS domain S-box-containing protein